MGLLLTSYYISIQQRRHARGGLPRGLKPSSGRMKELGAKWGGAQAGTRLDIKKTGKARPPAISTFQTKHIILRTAKCDNERLMRFATQDRESPTSLVFGAGKRTWMIQKSGFLICHSSFCRGITGARQKPVLKTTCPVVVNSMIGLGVLDFIWYDILTISLYSCVNNPTDIRQCYDIV